MFEIGPAPKWTARTRLFVLFAVVLAALGAAFFFMKSEHVGEVDRSHRTIESAQNQGVP